MQLSNSLVSQLKKDIQSISPSLVARGISEITRSTKHGGQIISFFPSIDTAGSSHGEDEVRCGLPVCFLGMQPNRGEGMGRMEDFLDSVWSV